MEHTIPFFIIIAKYLISETEKHSQAIKEQLLSPDNKLIEKVITILKKGTRVVTREDFEEFMGYLKNPNNPRIPGYIYDFEDKWGFRYFNDLPPMYNFEDLERMHDDPSYSVRLTAYKKRLEDREKGFPVIDEELQQEQLFKKMPNYMIDQKPSNLQQEQKPEEQVKFMLPKYKQERADVDTRILYLLEHPPVDSAILSRKYAQDIWDQLRKQQEETNARAKFQKQAKADPVPRFIFPGLLNEYEAFFNPSHSYIDEEGQVMQVDTKGDWVERGFCFKPGTQLIRMSNNVRLIYLLAAVILKKALFYFKPEVQKKAIFLETILNGRKTTNALLYTLLCITEKLSFDVAQFPEPFSDFLNFEGDINTIAADIMANFLENPAITAFATHKMDFTYQVLTSLKRNEETNNYRTLTQLAKAVMHLSSSSTFKLTMGSEKSIIEIYAYRLFINSFLEFEQPHALMLQYILQTFISLSRDPKFVFVIFISQEIQHTLQAIKQERIDILWRLLHFFSILENNNGDQKLQIQYSLFVIDIINQLVFSKAYCHPHYAEIVILDIIERYRFGLIPLEIFVSFFHIVSKLALSPQLRERVQVLIMKMISQPVEEKPVTPAKSPKTPTKDKKKATPEKVATPQLKTEDIMKNLSKSQQKEFKTATIIDEAKLDAYLKRLNYNLRYIYSYSGITKQMFNDIRTQNKFFRAVEDQHYQIDEFVEQIKKGTYEMCFNEMDLDSRNGNPEQMLEQFKEAIIGYQQFVLNEQSGLLKSNELVLPKDIPDMFLRFAFEDGLKLIILKNLQIDVTQRRNLQSELLKLHQIQSRLVDENVCKICKEMRNLANDNYQAMIKHYFQKFISISFFSSDISLQNQQIQEQEALLFDKTKIQEIKHIELFQTLLTFAALNQIKENDEQEMQPEEFQQNDDLKYSLALMKEVIQASICGSNENLNSMQYACFSMLFHKIFSINVKEQKRIDPYLDYFISRNFAQIGHAMFDVLLQSLKNPKTMSFNLNLEAIKNPANGHDCVIKSSKKGKVKIVQNEKKNAPSDPFYFIDRICIHAANHFILMAIHLLNQARKKYLIAMEKNFVSLMEQSILIVSFYAQATKQDPNMRQHLRKLCKSIVTFYFAVYEQFFTVYEQFFMKIDLIKLSEILFILKDIKNLKLANQILQILHSTMNAREDSVKGNKGYQAIFKILTDSGNNFINIDILRALEKQCLDQLAFNNDKLVGDKLKAFDNNKNSQTLQFKLSFCQLYFQLMIFFLSSDDADYYYKQMKEDAFKVTLDSLSTMMSHYLNLIQNSVDIDPVLINFYQTFTEQCTAFFWFLCALSGFNIVIQQHEALGKLIQSIKQTSPLSANFMFSFSGMMQKVTENLEDYVAFINKSPQTIAVIQYVLEKEEISWEALQFLTLAIKQLGRVCPKEKMSQMRPLAGPLRQVLTGKYFQTSESFIHKDGDHEISDKEKQAFIDQVKETLALLKPAEVYEIKDANDRISINRNRLIQGAGLMSLSTLNQLKNYQSTRGLNKGFDFGATDSTFQQTPSSGYPIVKQVDNEFERILEKYTPQRELDMLAIARNAQKVSAQSMVDLSSQHSMRKSQSVAQFYFVTDNTYKKYP